MCMYVLAKSEHGISTCMYIYAYLCVLQNLTTQSDSLPKQGCLVHAECSHLRALTLTCCTCLCCRQNLHTCIYACTYVCLCMYVFMYVHAECSHLRTLTLTCCTCLCCRQNLHMCVYMYIYIYIYIYACMCVCVCVYLNMCVCMYMQNVGICAL